MPQHSFLSSLTRQGEFVHPALLLIFKTSHFIDQIVDMNRSKNCSRRPIFKAADVFLHHCTCLVRLKERETASDEILKIFNRDICVKYIALLQPVQALEHFVCKYSIFFIVMQNSPVFQSVCPTVTTNLAVNTLIKSHEGVFSEQQIAENLRMPCSA